MIMGKIRLRQNSHSYYQAHRNRSLLTRDESLEPISLSPNSNLSDDYVKPAGPFDYFIFGWSCGVLTTVVVAYVAMVLK